MNILVINCGSSSIKYQLIDMRDEKIVTKGVVDRVGLEGSVIEQKTPGMDKVVIKESMEDHRVALKYLLKALVDEEYGAINSMDEIYAVGHRVVHGGEKFASSVVIDEEVMKVIEDCVELAPLHNPPNIMGIEACQELMPETPMVAVFDTAFHQTMTPESYMYAIPYKYYEKYGIRRYGFHGTSHKYVTVRTAELLEKDQKDLNIINCHLGNGSSLCGVKHGESRETNMGFTPLAGLPMGTRSGNIDPAIITFLMEKEDITFEEVNHILNKESGVLGISGLSSDFRDLELAEEDGNERAKLALDLFIKGVKKYIGAYMATMGEEVDAIVFTAGIGENSAYLRERICDGLESMGIELDKSKNDIRGKEAIISKDTSKVKVMVVPTNEELMIARDTLKLTK